MKAGLLWSAILWGCAVTCGPSSAATAGPVPSKPAQLAEAADRARLDAYFAALANAGEFNGAVLVAERGQVVYQRAFGHADFEARRANTNDTEFEMASIAKVFTAVAVLQLKEQGRLGLDDPLAKYFPAFPYEAITIRQLLSHSSGLSDQDLAPAFAAYKARIAPQRLSMNDLVPVLAEAKVDLKLRPGEKWWYCNLGYRLLALLVQDLSGESFDRYLKAHILRPAGMRRTYLKTVAIHRADTPNLARNYDYPFRYSSQRVRLDYDEEATFGDAGVVSTTGDMLRLDRALRDGRLLKPETLREAYTPARLADGGPDFVWLNIGGMGEADDGLGWFVFRDAHDGRIVWHTGGMPGCATLFLRNLDKDQVVVVFDNTGGEGLYKKGLSAMRLLNGEPPVAFTRSLARVYGRTLMADGADAAFVKLQDLRDQPERYALGENDLNNLGYQFLEQGHTAQALETFRINAALHAQSDNAYNSYGEALEKAGRIDEAVAMYRKSLRLNPDNTDSAEALKRLSR
ncbi:serine hydrolase domain-containing protein [Nannocystis radixulma]|uniref:Serine hydrolase n=1 Tax=Nannocystis radixulma TaxID=2995305 RepID=A0ABT5AYJ0_9BACT|nr:serine hydrolase [Nannocystis radixulma]MDC0666901.1 serine hydrolase [Nannocystis radixulma]